jgi:N-acetylmuramoyl-L-alanine amidase
MTRPARAGAIALALFALLPAQGSAWAQTAGKAEAPVCDRANFRVILDVGHSYQAGGARSARGVSEYEFNLWLATKIERDLLDAGFDKTVVLVTEGMPRPSLAERVAKANRMPAHLFLSIHHDSVPDKFLEHWDHDGKERGFSDRFKGHSIFISKDNSHLAASLLFGRLLGNSLKAAGMQYTPHYTEAFMGRRQRILVNAFSGVYRYDQLIVLRQVRLPSVLLEAGLIINRDEELLLATPEYRARISAAVTEAIDKFCALRLPKKPDQLVRRQRKEAMPLEPR